MSWWTQRKKVRLFNSTRYSFRILGSPSLSSIGLQSFGKNSSMMVPWTMRPKPWFWSLFSQQTKLNSSRSIADWNSNKGALWKKRSRRRKKTIRSVQRSQSLTWATSKLELIIRWWCWSSATNVLKKWTFLTKRIFQSRAKGKSTVGSFMDILA